MYARSVSARKLAAAATARATAQDKASARAAYVQHVLHNLPLYISISPR